MTICHELPQIIRLSQDLLADYHRIYKPKSSWERTLSLTTTGCLFVTDCNCDENAAWSKVSGHGNYGILNETWDHFCCWELSLTWHFLWKGQHRLNCQVDEISCKNVVKRECLLLSFLLPTTWKMIFKNLSFLSLFPLINKSISSGGCTKSMMFLSSLFNFELNPDRKYF